MSTAEEREPARWRSARSGYRVMKVALTVTAGVLLAAGLTMSSAHASVTPTPPKTSSVLPYNLMGRCGSGDGASSNNSYEFWGWCDGKGPTSYRAVAYCTSGEIVYGEMRWDGDRRNSYAICTINGLTGTLNNDWGYLLCSTNTGAGTYQGYIDKHGDISQWLYALGGNNIPAGGNLLCDWNVSGRGYINP